MLRASRGQGPRLRAEPGVLLDRCRQAYPSAGSMQGHRVDGA